MNCVERCSTPYIRKGKVLDDPMCTETNVDDPCCAILTCATDTGNFKTTKSKQN